MLSAQRSVLSAPCSVLGVQRSVLSAQRAALRVQRSALSACAERRQSAQCSQEGQKCSDGMKHTYSRATRPQTDTCPVAIGLGDQIQPDDRLTVSFQTIRSIHQAVGLRLSSMLVPSHAMPVLSNMFARRGGSESEKGKTADPQICTGSH